MRRALLTSLLTLLTLGVARSEPSTDYFARDAILSFARHLYQEGDYYRAAGEFQRYLAIHGEGQDADSIRFQMALSYREAGRPDLALGLLTKIAHRTPGSSIGCDARYETALTHFRLGSFRDCLDAVQLSKAGTNSSGCRSVSMRSLEGAAHMMFREWDSAHQLLRPHADTSSSDPLAAQLARVAQEGVDLRRKSPTLAGLCSAVLPGSGKVYAGRVTDGLYSLSMIAITAWQASRGFEDDGAESTRGWIFATLGFGFYLGNIYGSALAVSQRNDALELGLVFRVQDLVDRIGSVPGWMKE